MKKSMVALGMAVAMIFAGVVGPVVYAEDSQTSVITQDVAADCEKTIFGMKPWYAGLVTKDKDGRCVVGTPKQDAMAAFVWVIILNVLYDMFAILGVVSLGFIIYGGYWYLRSGGDPVFVARGKKTIQAAVVGTGIALLATLVTNMITTILLNRG